MKKVKAIIGTFLLSTILVSNAFAGGFTTAGVFSFFESIINALVDANRSDDTCPLRICTNCKPGTKDDGNGNCKPTEN